MDKSLKSERKRFYKVFGPMLAVFLTPILVVLAAVFALPSVYDGTFLGELSVKYDRLREAEGNKIVVVAGSSAAFGLDSKMMSEELGYDVVNFGLYANLGTKLMMDLSRDNVSDGDIVILAPEMNAQTLSLYFNAETAAQALDGNMRMLVDIESSEHDSLIGSIWGLAGDKLNYLLSGTLPENVGAYRKENFNSFGDNIYDRPYNELTGYGNPIVLDFRADLSDGVDGDYEEYIEYVNQYVADVRSRGAEVYFSFPPMNGLAIEEFNSDEQIRDFYENLSLSLDCKVISNIYDYILDDGYFYDSEFHLNNSGVTLRTVRLIDDIKRELGRTDMTLPVSELPSPAGKRPDCEDFELRRLANRNWAISGLTETGRGKKYLTIPDEVNGFPVTTVLPGAFDGCDSAVICTFGRNITDIMSGGVENAVNLVGLIIPEGVGAAHINLPASGLGNGCSADFRIYVPTSEYDEFVASESFSAYPGIIARDENFKFTLSPDGSYAILLSVTDSGRMRSELTLPDEWNGVPVRTVEFGAFEGAELLERVNLGVNVREIMAYAFSGVKDGLEVHIPRSILPEELSLPADPDELGGEVVFFVDWQEYQDYILNDSFLDYGDAVTTDNLYLELSETSDGSWTVTGVNSFGRELSELTVPETVSGKPVRTIAANAFAGTNIEVLRLGSNISRLDGGALRDSNVVSLILPQGVSAADVSVPNSMSEYLATDGCRAELKIYVDPELYEGFVSDYFWGDYGSRISRAEY